MSDTYAAKAELRRKVSLAVADARRDGLTDEAIAGVLAEKSESVDGTEPLAALFSSGGSR